MGALRGAILWRCVLWHEGGESCPHLLPHTSTCHYWCNYDDDNSVDGDSDNSDDDDVDTMLVMMMMPRWWCRRTRCSSSSIFQPPSGGVKIGKAMIWSSWLTSFFLSGMAVVLHTITVPEKTLDDTLFICFSRTELLRTLLNGKRMGLGRERGCSTIQENLHCMGIKTKRSAFVQ